MLIKDLYQPGQAQDNSTETGSDGKFVALCLDDFSTAGGVISLEDTNSMRGFLAMATVLGAVDKTWPPRIFPERPVALSYGNK